MIVEGVGSEGLVVGEGVVMVSLDVGVVVGGYIISLGHRGEASMESVTMQGSAQSEDVGCRVPVVGVVVVGEGWIGVVGG